MVENFIFFLATTFSGIPTSIWGYFCYFYDSLVLFKFVNWFESRFDWDSFWLFKYVLRIWKTTILINDIRIFFFFIIWCIPIFLMSVRMKFNQNLFMCYEREPFIIFHIFVQHHFTKAYHVTQLMEVTFQAPYKTIKKDVTLICSIVTDELS